MTPIEQLEKLVQARKKATAKKWKKHKLSINTVDITHGQIEVHHDRHPDDAFDTDNIGQLEHDADFIAIQTAFLAKTLVAMAFLDGAAATTGKQGFVANFAVTNFSRNEPLEEAVTVSVTLKPSTFAQWYTVPA